MPSFRDCIKEALSRKEINKLQADVAIAFADETEKQLTKAAGEVDLDGQLANLFERKQINAKRQKAMATLKFQEAVKDIERLAKKKSPRGKDRGFGSGLAAKLSKDPLSQADFSSIDVRTMRLQATAYRTLADSIEQFLPSKVGHRKSVDLFKKVMRELHLENSGDPQAKQIAGLFRKIFEDQRIRFNRAGGMILKREKWGFTHMHDSLKVKRTPYPEWRDFIYNRVDWEKTTDELGLTHSPEAIESILAKSYENITGFGTKDIKNAMRGTRKVANRHQDHRVLQFKSGTSWLEYNEKFGNPDLWGAIQNHINGMARETSLMEIFGPDPFGMFRQLRSISESVDPGKATGLTGFDNVWNVVTNKTSTIAPHKYSANLGAFAQGTRNLLGIALLPRAFVTSFSDIWSIKMTRGFNGTQGAGIVKEIVADMVGARKDLKRLSMKNGISARGALERAHGAMRFTDAVGMGWTSKLSDKFHRITLLTPWTTGGQEAYGREMAFTLGELTGTNFNKLSEKLRTALSRYGIGEADWKAAANAVDVLPETNGLKFLDPFKIADDSITAKFQEMIITEMDIAVPHPDARVRAIITGGKQKGDVTGEIIRSIGLFKSFPITMMMSHLGRGISTGNPNRSRYIASLFIGYTTMGALVRQIKSILGGKDPESMATTDFWLASALTGGGLGFFGDLLFQETGKYGNGTIENFLGPVAQLLDDTAALTKGNLDQVVRGDDPDFWVEANRFRRRYVTPKTWYTDLVFERMVMDQLFGDPKTFRAMEKKLKRETGQEFFWRPGDGLPNRAPDISKAFQFPNKPPKRRKRR